MVKILFVCLGNICRSPLAEGIFKNIIAEREMEDFFFVDSAGTSSYHCGATPDPRSIEIAKKNSVALDHKAQQFAAKHLFDFDYIIPMDEKNLEEINAIKNGLSDLNTGQIILMRTYDDVKNGNDVPDPYFGGMDGFDFVYKMLWRSCLNFLEFLIKKHNIPTG